MSKLDAQNKTYGTIAALQTIVNTYPKLNLMNAILGMFQIVSPIQFILHILRLLGLSREDIINWLATILCGEKLYEKIDEVKEGIEETKENIKNKNDVNTKTKVKEGLLDAIEYSIKTILFLNIKDLFSGCKIEPFVPSWMIKSETNIDNSIDNNVFLDNGIGISIPVSSIDMFGVLEKCPVNDEESIYYFDCKPSIFGENYTPNDTYKSTDFNVFLWHVINKSDANGDIWDNRNFVKKQLLLLNESDKINKTHLKDDFFAPKYRERKQVINGIQYKPILCCQYHNNGGIQEGGAIIKVTLPSDTYTYKINDTSVHNRTIFEFNYDYIFGLKLFDSKTLVANIINSLLHISSTIQIPTSFSYEREVIKGEIKLMIQNIINTDEDEVNSLCATSFSNDEYNRMLNNANSYINTHNLKTPNFEDALKILEDIKKLEYSSNIEQDIAKLLNTVSEATKPTEEVNYNITFPFDLSFIYAIIEELMVEIVMQIMSPKVMMLYYINACVMNGAALDIESWTKFGMMFKNPDEFMKKFSNLIINMIRQILDILIKQLLEFLIEKITPMLKILAMELLLETIRDYKDLIMLIIRNCTIPIPMFNIGKEALKIDDVRYADIVPVLEVPNNDC